MKTHFIQPYRLFVREERNIFWWPFGFSILIDNMEKQIYGAASHNAEQIFMETVRGSVGKYSTSYMSFPSHPHEPDLGEHQRFMIYFKNPDDALMFRMQWL